MIWFFSEPKAAVQEFTPPGESEETKTERLLGNTLTSLLKNPRKIYLRRTCTEYLPGGKPPPTGAVTAGGVPVGQWCHLNWPRPPRNPSDGIRKGGHRSSPPRCSPAPVSTWDEIMPLQKNIYYNNTRDVISSLQWTSVLRLAWQERRKAAEDYWPFILRDSHEEKLNTN